MIKRKPNFKMFRGLNGHFFREVIRMANKHMKRFCSTSLVIKENVN